MEGLTIDAGTWAQWASAVAALVAVLISAVSLVRSARKSELDLVHGRITGVKETQGTHAERLARIEAELDHLPTKEMVGNLATSLARLEGQTAAMNAKVDGMGDRVTRIGNSVDMLVENELRERKT